MHYDLGYFDLEQKLAKPSTTRSARKPVTESPVYDIGASDQDALLHLGMDSPVIGRAEQFSPRKPQGRRPARGLDGEARAERS